MSNRLPKELKEVEEIANKKANMERLRRAVDTFFECEKSFDLHHDKLHCAIRELQDRIKEFLND